MRDGQELSLWQLAVLTMQLSIPAIMAQLSSIVMQYIDASMVGHLGSGEAASIGLMSSSTWMMGGLCSALSVGFTVQVAHFIGAKEEDKARGIVRQGLAVAVIFSCILRCADTSKASAVAGRGRRDKGKCGRLFPDILSFTSGIAVKCNGRRYASMQWKYEGSQHASYFDVHSGCFV